MRRSEQVLVAALAVAIAACAHTRTGETLTTRSGEREYILHLPAHPPAGHYPLIIALHGGGGTPEFMRKETRFDELADREGFAVVYPRGINKHWNDGRTTKDIQSQIDDVAFLRALIDHLVATHPIDPDRVFATGISNGGIMSYRLGCDLADKIAAIAPVVGQVSEYMASRCAPVRAVSVLATNSTADPLVPWRGGHIAGELGTVVGTPESIGLFARVNGCAPEPTAEWEPDRDPGDGTTVQHVTFSGCRDGVSVELLNINHGGHTWPGGMQYASRAIIGPVSREFSASERIWQFFAHHGRTAPVRSAGD